MDKLRLDSVNDVTFPGVIVGIVGVLLFLFIVVYMALVFGKATPDAKPLDSDDVFMKAQFCIQTGRIPIIVATQVTCDDYKHGHRQEEAP